MKKKTETEKQNKETTKTEQFILIITFKYFE